MLKEIKNIYFIFLADNAKLLYIDKEGITFSNKDTVFYWYSPCQANILCTYNLLTLFDRLNFIIKRKIIVARCLIKRWFWCYWWGSYDD